MAGGQDRASVPLISVAFGRFAGSRRYTGKNVGQRLVSEREPDDLGELARGLEDESYRRWLAAREDAPAGWRVDEAFSQVVYLTPAELTALAGSIRGLLRRYRGRDNRPDSRPEGAAPVAVVSRLFPLREP
jgi:hypothetical protein